MAAGRQHRRSIQRYGWSQTSFVPPAACGFTRGTRKTARALRVQLRCTKAKRGIGRGRRQAADTANPSNSDGGWGDFRLSKTTFHYAVLDSLPFASLTTAHLALHPSGRKGKRLPERPLYWKRCLLRRRRFGLLHGCLETIKEGQRQEQ
jgi:hypothetical protein